MESIDVVVSTGNAVCFGSSQNCFIDGLVGLDDSVEDQFGIVLGFNRCGRILGHGDRAVVDVQCTVDCDRDLGVDGHSLSVEVECDACGDGEILGDGEGVGGLDDLVLGSIGKCRVHIGPHRPSVPEGLLLLVELLGVDIADDGSPEGGDDIGLVLCVEGSEYSHLGGGCSLEGSSFGDGEFDIGALGVSDEQFSCRDIEFGLCGEGSGCCDGLCSDNGEVLCGSGVGCCDGSIDGHIVCDGVGTGSDCVLGCVDSGLGGDDAFGGDHSVSGDLDGSGGCVLEFSLRSIDGCGDGELSFVVDGDLLADDECVGNLV